MVRELCPKCGVSRNMILSTSRNTRTVANGKPEIVITKSYHCESCKTFVRSEDEQVLNTARKFLIPPAEGRNEPIKDLDNAQRTVLVDKDTAGAEDLTFAHCRFAAKTSAHKKHVHQHAEEVIYILSGKGISGVEDREIEMGQGDTMFIPRGAVHWFYNPYDEPVEMIFIYTRPSLQAAGYQVVE